MGRSASRSAQCSAPPGWIAGEARRNLLILDDLPFSVSQAPGTQNAAKFDAGCCFARGLKPWPFVSGGVAMRKIQLLALVALAALLCCVQPAWAGDISVTIGAVPVSFTSGQTINSSTYTSAVSGQPAPFNAFCGSDITANCSASWTFNYTVPAGDTITGATLTLGIWDIDSAASGDQVGSFTLDGSDDLTVQLNSVSEGLNGGLGAPNSQYDVLTISIPGTGTDFTDLGSGTATFALTLSGPGLGVIGPTTFNGAGLVFSTLDITTTPGGGSPVPEPATWALLGLGLLALTAVMPRR
jgi:PEP-CTERM motif-containing protein